MSGLATLPCASLPSKSGGHKPLARRHAPLSGARSLDSFLTLRSAAKRSTFSAMPLRDSDRLKHQVDGKGSASIPAPHSGSSCRIVVAALPQSSASKPRLRWHARMMSEYAGAQTTRSSAIFVPPPVSGPIVAISFDDMTSPSDVETTILRACRDDRGPAVVSKLLALTSPQAAMLWLKGNNAHLGGAQPLVVLQLDGSGPVLDALQAFEQGAFA